MLPLIDSKLHKHLIKCDVQAQLYGMRWARLLCGRELPLKNELSLRLWDYLFATCINIDMDLDIMMKIPFTTTSSSSSFPTLKSKSIVSDTLSLSASSSPSYDMTTALNTIESYPILLALQDVMVLMLLHVCNSLLLLLMI